MRPNPVASPPPAETFVAYDARSKLWTLERDLWVTSRGWTLFVPAGFVSDLSSVPRALWPLIAPMELSVEAPLVHDWLYEHDGQIRTRCRSDNILIDSVHSFSRADTDAFLRDIAEQEGVPEWRCWTAYHGVRLGGWMDWNRPPAQAPSHPRV